MNHQFEKKELFHEFEAKRKAAIRSWLKSIVFIVIVVLAVEYWLYTTGVEGIGVFFIPPFFAVFALVISFWWSTADFKSGYKESIIKPLLESWKEGLVYKPLKYIDQTMYEESQLFNRQVDRYQGDDYIRGQHKGATFQLSELHTEYTTHGGSSSGSTTNYHTIFKGLFCVVDLPEHLNIEDPVLVLPTSLESLLESWGVPPEKSSYKRTDQLDIGKSEFSDSFYVYGSDPAAAQGLLSPELRQRILHFQPQVENQIHLSFTRKKVFIALSGFKSYFEPRLFSSLDDPATLREYTDDLDLVLDVIECIVD